MKRKIYSKLFKFSTPKSWRKETDTDTTTYKSDFYREYLLQFKSSNLGWFYKVYDGNSIYSNVCSKGFVTLNLIGKLLVTVGLFIISSIILRNGFDVVGYKIYTGLFISYFILSFFLFSIFNWTIYRALRRAEYASNNKQKIKRKEEEEILKEKIINVVNKTISKDPRLARKTKLLKLKKKYFWQEWFNKDDTEEEKEE